MSSGVFNVITNSSNNDNLLHATEFLKNRINRFIMRNDPHISEEELLTLPNNSKFDNISNSILPSLNEIEKSHNTFINGSYKPSVILASEYIKVPNSNPKFNSKIEYQMPTIGNFTSDCVLHIKLSGMSAKDDRDRVRYVAMLGHKLIKRVQLVVSGGSIVDEYDTDDYNIYYQYELDDKYKIGHLQNIGQETPTEGFLTSDPRMNMFREQKFMFDGNQTLKYSHDAIDLFIPILFWFKDFRTPLPSLPWGQQLQIKVELADVVDIVGFADNGGGGAYNPPTIEFCDLYVNQLFTLPEIFNLYSKKFVFNIIRTHRSHKQIISTDVGQDHAVLLSRLKNPTEAIYFSFRPRENLSLSQYWHKSCKLTKKIYKVPVMAKDPNNILIVKFSSFANINDPLSSPNYIIITSTSSLSMFDDAYATYDLVITSGTGYNSQDILQNRYTVASYIGTTSALTIDGSWNGFMPDTSTTFELYTPQLGVNSVVYYTESPVVSSISLEIQGIEIFKNIAEQFYANYLPTKFANTSVPTECGFYLMPFCNKMFNHNPSGSINLGLVREIYLKFTSELINKNYPVDLIVLSRTINFLIINNGSLTLKYNV